MTAATPDFDRYHRQAILPGFGPDSQRRLAEGHAMVVGCGALGTVAADLLARAGVGTLSIIDRDVVELTNLQRQTLYTEQDARESLPKAEAAAHRLHAVNSQVRICAIVEDFSPENAEPLVRTHPAAGVLIDCTDNFETRYLLNDVAVKCAIPLVYGGAVATGGVQMTVLPGRPCLRCIFPDPPAPGSMPTCDTAGIFAPASAVIGALQAAEALRILARCDDHIEPSLLSIDVWSGRERRMDLSGAKQPDCPCCAQARYEFLQGRGQSGATVLCGRNSVQITPAARAALDLAELAGRLAAHGQFKHAGSLVRGSIHGESRMELTVFADGRAIVGGTTDPARARAVYARYIGG